MSRKIWPKRERSEQTLREITITKGGNPSQVGNYFLSERNKCRERYFSVHADVALKLRRNT